MKKIIFSSKPQQISQSALLVAENIFGDLKKQKLLIIGNNDFSVLICKSFKKIGIKNSKDLDLNEKVIDNSERFTDSNIINYLKNYDILITGMECENFIVKKNQVIEALKKRKQKPLFLIDTGIPGNIDSEISKIDNCFLFDLNDLEQFINDLDDRINKDSFKKEDFEYLDEIDELVPSFSKNLKLDTDQIYLLEDKLRNFFKTNTNIEEKLGILNFLKLFTKK